MAPAVEIQALSKEYGRGESRRTALRELDLIVEAGEAVALVGSNGAGKSTLIDILSTVLRPTTGTARVLGLDVSRQPLAVREAIGVVRQRPGLPPSARSAKLLTLHARLLGLSRSEARMQVSKMLELLDLGDGRGRIRTLSGGMRRRLDIGLSLLGHPRVLLLDEPAAGLDLPSRHRMWREIARFRTNGGAVLFTSQSIEETQQLATRVAVIEDGTIANNSVSPASLPQLLSEYVEPVFR